MVEPSALLSLGAAAASGALGALVFLRGPRERFSRLFLFWTLLVALWQLLGFQVQGAPTPEEALRWARLRSIPLVFLPFGFFHMAYAYAAEGETPGRLPGPRPLLPLYYLLPGAPFLLLALGPGALWMSEAQRGPWGWTFLYGPAFLFFAVYLLANGLGGVMFLLRSYLKVPDIQERKRTRSLLLGVAPLFTLGVAGDFFLPLLEAPGPETSPFLVLLMAATVGALATEKGVLRPVHQAVRPVFRYRLEEGTTAVVDEKSPRVSLEAFYDHVARGHRGLCISPTEPDVLRKRYPLEGVTFYWITEAHGETTIYPVELERIGWTVREFAETHHPSVILVDGLTALAARNGFDPAHKLFQALQASTGEFKSLLLLPIDFDALEPDQRPLLQQGVRMLQSGKT
ncbi:MAG: DUF835 domain-containing protein [Euryarchaeota archaeon]|nr:DUF835 domain-containing protein [Euryarchaeota archaeon]